MNALDNSFVKPISRYAVIPSAGPTWTDADEQHAARQGWLIDHCAGPKCIRAVRSNRHGPRLHFSNDTAATNFVGMLAVLGDETARRAFAYLANYCGVAGTAEFIVQRSKPIRSIGFTREGALELAELIKHRAEQCPAIFAPINSPNR